MRPSLIILVGLPGSGKSSYRETLQGYLTLSTDDFVEEQARKIDSTYDRMWSHCIDAATKDMNARYSQGLKARQSIVYDRTNVTLAARRKIMSQVPKDYVKIAVYFEIEETLRQQRILNRPGKTIPVAADVQMVGWYTRPTISEGFDHVLDGLKMEALAA